MRQTLALLLALLLTLGLCACGAPASQTGQSAAASPLRGSLDGDSYRNELLKLRIALPEGWRFCDENRLASANGLSVSELRTADPAELIGQKGQLILLMMENESKSVVNLTVQPQQKELARYSDAELFQQARESIVKNYEATLVSGIGVQVESYRILSMQVGGEPRTVLQIRIAVVNSKGARRYGSDEYLIWYREDENWLGLLSLGIQDGSDPQPILDQIRPL